MAKYISLVAVLAEIDKRLADNKKDIERASHKNLEDYFEGYEDALTLFKDKFLVTLDTKEVDLDFIKEVDVWIRDNGDTNGFFNVEELAKYFFDLGMAVSNKTQKGE